MQNRRYLRARKWIPEEAFRQFKDTEDWRKDNNLAELYDVIEVEDYDQARKLVCTRAVQDIESPNTDSR